MHDKITYRIIPTVETWGGGRLTKISRSLRRGI